MKIKPIFWSLLRVNKRKVESEPQVYLEDDKIKFKNIKIYAGVFDIIEEIHLSEIEEMFICCGYDIRISEASIVIKIKSREETIDINNFMTGFEVFIKEIFNVLEIDKSFSKFYEYSTKAQYIYPPSKFGELVKFS